MEQYSISQVIVALLGWAGFNLFAMAAWLLVRKFMGEDKVNG